MRTFTVLLFLLALGGCSHQKTYAPVQPSKNLGALLSETRDGDTQESLQSKSPPLPTCYSKPQCDAMWSEATVRIQTLTGMRLQVATDAYLNTYNASPGRITGEARRVPRPDGSTVIQATFNCNYCSDELAAQAHYLFMLSVRAAGAGFPEPYVAPSWDDEVRKSADPE